MNPSDDSSDRSSDTDQKIASKSRLFSVAQTSLLKAFFDQGMVGVGEQYSSLIEKAAQDTALSVQQVKVRFCEVVKQICTHVIDP